MTASRLIEILSKVPPQSEVLVWWDLGARGSVDAVFIDSDENTVIAGEWGTLDDECSDPKKLIYSEPY